MSELDARSLPVVGMGFALWRRQFFAVIGAEIGKSLFSRSAALAYGLAALPILLILVIAFADHNGDPISSNIDHARRIYSILYSGFVLGAVVFLGSAAIFTSLFRGEILNRSMHYYLLSPIKREVLVLGKFCTGLITAMSLFGITTCLSYLLMYIPFGMEQLISDLVNGQLLSQLSAYLCITLLGCVGYGSIFLMTGLLFKNPLFPVLLLAGWEMIHFMLPPAFKLFSVVYYLKGLMPIPLDEGPLAVVVAPPSIWVSFVGIAVMACLAVGLAVFLLKRLEVWYTDD